MHCTPICISKFYNFIKGEFGGLLMLKENSKRNESTLSIMGDVIVLCGTIKLFLLFTNFTSFFNFVCNFD